MTLPRQVLRLAFARGVAPSKWASRWAEARPDLPLELVPLALDGRVPTPRDGGAPPAIDVTLERVPPGARPAGTEADQGTAGAPIRFAVRLYVESVALVVPADHELSAVASVDREALDLVVLLDHPDHSPEWPEAQPWADASWMPKHAGATMDLVATGAGAALLPVPLARHLAHRREHAVLTVSDDVELLGTEIWASWDIACDDADVQQLIGVLRGRTARSSRGAKASDPAPTATSAPSRSSRPSTTARASRNATQRPRRGKKRGR